MKKHVNRSSWHNMTGHMECCEAEQWNTCNELCWVKYSFLRMKRMYHYASCLFFNLI